MRIAMPSSDLYFRSGFGIVEIGGGFYCTYCFTEHKMDSLHEHVTSYEHDCSTANYFGRPLPERRLTVEETEEFADAMFEPAPTVPKKPKIIRVKRR